MGRGGGKRIGARERYAALTAEQRAQVDAIFEPDIACGWIPKEADIEAAIDAVLMADRHSES
jgi:hypothetical protein